MRKIFALTFLLDFLINGIISNCWVAVFTREGFTLYQAAISLAVMCFGIAIFELPTGYLADRYLGRRGSTRVGIAILVTSMITLYASSNFVVACVAIAFTGLGSTFISGARQAWLRNIVSDHYPERLKRFFFDVDLVARAGTICGVWAGAAMIDMTGAASVWGLAAVVGILAIGMTLTLPRGSTDHAATHSSASLQSSSLLSIIKVPALLLLLAASLFFGIEDGVRGVIFQPLVLKMAGGTSIALAYQCTITLLPRILGTLTYRRFLSGSPYPTQYLTLAMIAIALIEATLVSVTEYWAFASLWAVAVFAFGIFFPLRDTVMHETIDRMHAERWRATISSLDSLIGNLLQAFTCLGIAATITEANVGDFFGIGAIALVGCSGCYYLASLVARKSAQREISDGLRKEAVVV